MTDFLVDAFFSILLELLANTAAVVMVILAICGFNRNLILLGFVSSILGGATRRFWKHRRGEWED